MIYFCILNSVPLIYTSVPILLPYRLDCSSFIVSFDTEKWASSGFVLLHQGCSGYSGSLESPCKFVDQLVNFCKVATWVFDRDRIDSVGQFGSITILTILCLPIHILEMSFYLFRSLMSFDSVLPLPLTPNPSLFLPAKITAISSR